ncbi:MAG: hypothetical protein ABI622_01750 [Chloroflexota bacterium]
MQHPRPVPPRPRASLLVLVSFLALAMVACNAGPSVPSVMPSPSVPPVATPDPTPVPTPSPTPLPTPRFTNEPDPELEAIIPTRAGGVTLVVPPIDEFGLTPGDMGGAYGDLGSRFASLAIGYVGDPRTTLYAMRVDGEPPTTEDLEPYLATAGRKVGIAGLDPDPWSLETIGDHRTWVRGEDNATAAGTMIYTWAADGIVFLLIGVDDAVNRAILAALPGEPPPTPSPRPSRSPGSSSSSPSGSSATSASPS